MMALLYLLLMLVSLARIVNSGNTRSSFLLLSSSSELPSSPGPSLKPKAGRHISDFTDPDTGFNPFLDLQEGHIGAFERKNIDQERPVPRWHRPFDDPTEGDSGGTRRHQGPEYSRGNNNNSNRLTSGDFQKSSTDPKIPENRRTVVEFQEESVDLKAFTEDSLAVTEGVDTVTSSSSTTTTEDTLLHSNAFDDVKHLTSNDVELVTSNSKNSFFVAHVTIAALTIGATLALMALMMAVVCRWRTNRMRTRTLSMVERDPPKIPELIIEKPIDEIVVKK